MRISDWSSDVCSSDLWQHYNGDLVQTLLSASRLADVTILTRTMAAPKNAGAPLPIAADVAVPARAPVLAVPPKLNPFDCGGRARIAWTGSYKAATRLRSPIPRLRQAQEVNLTHERVTGREMRWKYVE